MFTRSIRQALSLVLVLSFSGAAFARNPPVLVEQQRAAAPASSGYRDINWRFGNVAARHPEVMRAPGGYRDVGYRFGNPRIPTQAASAASTSRWR